MPLKKKRTGKKKAVKKRVLKKKTATRQAVRKKAKKKIIKPKSLVKKSKENVIGTITHYFPKVRAAVVKLKATLTVGDTIKIKGHTTDFTQGISSMQIDHVPVNEAKKGEEIGVLVDSRVRQHDIVYKV